jgi:hypothetical protein
LTCSGQDIGEKKDIAGLALVGDIDDTRRSDVEGVGVLGINQQKSGNDD